MCYTPTFMRYLDVDILDVNPLFFIPKDESINCFYIQCNAINLCRVNYSNILSENIVLYPFVRKYIL